MTSKPRKPRTRKAPANPADLDHDFDGGAGGMLPSRVVLVDRTTGLLDLVSREAAIPRLQANGVRRATAADAEIGGRRDLIPFLT